MRANSSVFILVVAVILGGVAAFMTREWLNSHMVTAQGAAVETVGTIVVANKALSFGTSLSPDDVSEVPWPGKSMPEGSFASAKDLLKDGKRVVLSAFVRNEPIVVSKVTAPNQRASLSAMMNPANAR